MTQPPNPTDQNLHQVLHHLGERVKELTALHNTARILQADPSNTRDLLSQLVDLLPPAWQYPEITAGRIRLHDTEVRSPHYRPSPWTQQAKFTYGQGHEGLIEVVYLEERPQEVEGPFLAEERNLINSLAEMLRLHLERKLAEASLRQLSKVFMDATDPILIEDLSGHIQDLNAEVEQAYGWSREELLGQPVTLLIPPENHREAEELRIRCKQGKLVRNIESLRQSKTGCIWPVLVTLSPLTDENGRMTGIASLTKDISALKEAERQLQQAYAELERRVEERTASLQQANAQLEEEIRHRLHAEAKLEDMIQEIQHSHETLTAILHQLDLGTAMLDPEGRISFLNNAAARLLGTRIESCLGRSWVEVLPFEHEEDRRTVEHLIRQPGDCRDKRLTRLRSALGQCPSWVEIDVRDDPRNPEGRILFLYDMTEVQDLRARLSDTLSVRDIVGKSAPMQLVFQLIHELARVDSTVLIEGETGTGKELVARAIHHASHRREGPFIAVNCAGLTEALVASQLFGHRRGAFTGAVSDQQGLFEAAEGGTLFLDEIGDIPLVVQTSLLRVLQEREIIRLGETKTRKVNVRVIAATHHNLARDVEQGQFRADLLYRIRVGRIWVPPLRDRREDIPLLASTFLAHCRAVTGRPIEQISHEAMRELMAYAWPGNVRELKHAIEFAGIRCRGTVIQTEDLPPEILQNLSIDLDSKQGTPFRIPPPYVHRASPDEERTKILKALHDAQGNRSLAAKYLGISRVTLYRRLARLGIPVN